MSAWQTRSCGDCQAPAPANNSDPSGNNPLINTVLPESGTGFRTYNREEGGVDQVGVKEAIDWFIQAGEHWAPRSDIPFQVGDISRRGGGPFPPHESHQNGREADLRPFRKDGQMLPTNINDESYDRTKTREFVKFVKSEEPDAVVLFNDPQLIKEGLTRYYKGHHNHLHLRLPGGLAEEPVSC